MIRRDILASIAMAAIPTAAFVAPIKPLLTISGRIGRVNNTTNNTYDFTEAALLALPQANIRTSTSWTPVSVFVGPLMLTVMREAGVTAGTLTVKALDDLSVPIPWDDLVRFGVILAHSLDGERLSDKRWGPLWTIYPRDQYPEALSGPIAESRSLWQVNRIEVNA